MKALMKGFDTSSNQCSTVNPQLAKENGYDFCILRIGNGHKKDKCFEYDYELCKHNKLKLGVYFGTTGLTRDVAIEDAKQTLEWLKGRKLDLPVVYDMEVKGMGNTARKIPNAIQYNAFTGYMRANGYPTMYYCSASRWRNWTEQDMIYDPLWLAAYGKNDGSVYPVEDIKNIGRKIDMYQYTSAAVKDDFFPYKLDRNLLYTPISKLMEQPKVFLGYTTREITVWTCPAKKDEYRLKKVPEGYEIQLYPEKIKSKTSDGDYFYRTIKNCYVLSKYIV